MRGDLIAIRPTGVGIELKGIAQAILGECPTAGDAGFDRECCRVSGDEAFQQREEYVVFGYAGDDVWIECFRFGADADVEFLGLVPALDIALLLHATGRDTE